MINLTFGEQVKIVLSRKGMTIKELAERIEEETGNKMSRQNLTQRLGRDNFQEQDMRAIAGILGCSFQLSILASAEAVQKASAIEEVLPTDRELHKLEAKKEQRKAREEAREQAERDITIGEFVDMMENPLSDAATAQGMEAELIQKEEIHIQGILETDTEELRTAEPQAGADAAADREHAEESGHPKSGNTWEVISVKEQTPHGEAESEMTAEQAAQQPEEAQRRSKLNKIANIISGPRREDTAEAGTDKQFEPIKKRDDEEEDMQAGDVNPYTGHEYQTNSVRMHPKRIGYVQVYDRKEHKWTDMTEWAFLGMEERKRAVLGKDYDPPVYLD